MSDTDKTTEAKRPKQGRSPAYPGVPLKAALEKAKAQYETEGKYAIPMTSAFASWGYGAKSSGGREVRAAMRYFGLITIEGDGETGKIKLTDDVLRVILDEREDDTEKRAIIRRLGLNPLIHKKLAEQFPDGIKSDATVSHFLIFEQGFNKSAAEALVAEFKDTASFIGLYQPQNGMDKKPEPAHIDEEKPPRPNVAVGSKVQWTSQGVDQFPDGGVVLAVSEDGLWVFTDKGTSAVPISEVTIMEAATIPHGAPPPTPAHVLVALANKGAEEQKSLGTRKAVFPVEDGDVTLIFPEAISREGLVELGQYLDIFLKKEQKKQGAF